MNNEEVLVNRVANSGLITIDLEHFYPQKEIIEFDIKPFLFRELILKELDYRESLKNLDWSNYENKIVAVHCSTDAIIPTWAYMLISNYAVKVNAEIYFGNTSETLIQYYQQFISKLDISAYIDAKIVIKGCSDKPVPAAAYMYLTQRLIPVASSIMYGEPCSTVPVYKKPKT